MRGLSAKCREMGFSRNYFVEEKPVDQVHGSVDRAGPVHHGPTAIATRGSSPELGLWPLHCPRAPTERRGRKREAQGCRFRAHRGSECGEAASRRRCGWWWRSARRGLGQGVEKGEGGAGEERMPGRPFIGSEGERGGWASERNGRRWWCAIMAMKVVVSEGD
jgi:hypothetical protein